MGPVRQLEEALFRPLREVGKKEWFDYIASSNECLGFRMRQNEKRDETRRNETTRGEHELKSHSKMK